MRAMTEKDLQIKREYAEMNLDVWTKELKRQKMHMNLYSSEEYLAEFGGYDMQKCALLIRDCNAEIERLKHDLDRY